MFVFNWYRNRVNHHFYNSTKPVLGGVDGDLHLPVPSSAKPILQHFAILMFWAFLRVFNFSVFVQHLFIESTCEIEISQIMMVLSWHSWKYNRRKRSAYESLYNIKLAYQWLGHFGYQSNAGNLLFVIF